jgi:ankyrin repeat protein
VNKLCKIKSKRGKMQYIRYEDLGLTRTDTSDVNQSEGNANTPLHRAIERGDIIELKMLLSNGAYVNIVGKDGETPLHLAVKNGNVQVIKLLLALGADVNAQDNDGETPSLGSSER